MTQKLYSIGVTIYATAYVRADDEDDAVRKAKAELLNECIFAEEGLFTGRDYDDLFHDDETVDVTLAPAMTVGEVYDEIDECVYDPDEEPTETQQGLIPIPDGYAEG
jgi:hypothetical protein